ncbi:unnamed protein product [Adineta steineri]|uniref:beta-ketoacyl-[acyl-carrier-protein] synthase I n=1 Tax=Adineta steineri TaxID=433720 RepID=A0A818MD26_9BILA|nr:unnamed protein product [Adineta steineri]CAF3585202.1 unnamed protein product [Adineta steineri]
MSISRVVITGLGVVSPLGVGIDFNWHRLLDNYSGIVPLDQSEYAGIPCQIAGRVPISSENKNQDGSLNFSNYFSRMSDLKSMSLASAFALVAAHEAIEQSQILLESKDRTRIGVSIGNGMAGIANTCTILDQTKTKGLYRGMSPFYITQILSNSSAGHVSIRYKLQGPNLCNSSACAAGVQAIGDGYNMIRLGHADAMICGGTEATINPITISGFARMRALSTTFNEQPKFASRPFDRQRDGFVMGEGAALLILERLECAEKRGATIFGEILGYGLSADASHITNPSGIGALNCMKNALDNAKLNIEDIGYINAHATSTPIGDRIERQAITQLFQSNNRNVLVSSTKGHTGHLLGAAGALESLFTILACYHAQCPPTLNYKNNSDDSEESSLVNIIPDDKPSLWNNKKRIALKNSFGFGGTNSLRLRSTNQPKEKFNEPLLCPDSETYRKMMNETQFECYYDAIKQWTFPSRILTMNKDDIQALHDGHTYFKSLSTIDNDDQKTEACFQQYPTLSKLANAIDSCDIKRPMFVRLSTRSPKDAILLLNKEKFKKIFQQILSDIQPDNTSERNQQLIALDEASIRILAINDGFHAIQILLASERIQDDLKSSSSLNLIIREFHIDRENLKSEFRAFIYKRQFTALTQYNEYILDKILIEKKDSILKSIKDFFQKENLLERIPYENCVLDLILIQNQVYICEINPLAEFAGTGLFSWLNDRKILLGYQEFEFRIKENETNEYSEANNQWLSLINNF